MRETARAPKCLSKREFRRVSTLSPRHAIRIPITHREIESRQKAIGAFAAPRVELPDINTIQVRHMHLQRKIRFCCKLQVCT